MCFGGKRQLEPISFKPKLPLTPPTISQCRLATVRYGYEKGLSISDSFYLLAVQYIFRTADVQMLVTELDCEDHCTACVGLITRNNCWYAGAEKVLILQKRYPQQILSCICPSGTPELVLRH